MKIRVVSSRYDIPELDPKEKVVHLVAPPTAITLLELVNRWPKIEAIEVHPSRSERLSKPSLCLLKVQGVKIFPGGIQGYRTDMAEHYVIDEGLIFKRAGELQAEGKDSGEIVSAVAMAAGISQGMVEFILKK